MAKLNLFVRFLMLAPEQVAQLEALDITLSKQLTPEVNAIFSDQFFIESQIHTLPKLKYLQLATSGLDLVDIHHPNLQEATISGSRGIFNLPMAEYVIGHLLSVYQHHRFFTQTQKDQQWRPSRHQDHLHGKRVAIIGTGQIGTQLAKTFAFFGAKVDGFNRRSVDSIYFQNLYPLNDLSTRLREYDVVVLALALTPETKHILNANILKTLTTKTILINIGRSALIDEAALIEQLQQKQLKYAILDTFNQEPLPKDHPFWSFEQVTITPHISFTSKENLERMFQALYTNLQLYLQNERLINQFQSVN
jgi:phosphoglycerate dehydrogenase-like enzyme